MAGNSFTGNSADPDFTVTGGVGSIHWTMAEIVESAAGLARAAQLMDPLLDRLKAERLWLGQACADAVTVPSGVLDAMVRAEWRCGAAQAGLARLAQRAGQAAATYAAVEAHNANTAAALMRLNALRDGWLLWTAGPLAPLKSAVDFSQWLKQAQQDGVRNATEAALRDGGAFLAGALGPSVALVYFLAHLRRTAAAETGLKPALLLRKTFDYTALARPGTLAVRPVPPQEWDRERSGTRHVVGPNGQLPNAQPPNAQPPNGQPWTLDATFESMLEGSNDAYAYPPGSIGVVQVTRPDGSCVWVVHLPGTEDWSTVDSNNPFDMEGNLEALTAGQQELFEQQKVIIQELIKTALQGAGALPGQDVVLTGHSGGGIHAAAAAANPAFLEKVNVRMIVIAGAPAGNAVVDQGIAVLGLENEHDLVTAADFHAPPPHRGWVTVTSHRPPVAGGVLEDLVQAHSLENYLLDAAALDQSNDPAVTASREELKKLLGVAAGSVAAGAGIAGRKWVFQGKDNNRAPPQRTRAWKPAPVPGKDFTPGAR